MSGMESLVKEFLDYCTFERGLSQNTILKHKQNLNRLINDHKNSHGQWILFWNNQNIVNWLSTISRKAGSPTVKSNICTLKSFFKFLKIDGYILKNPIQNMELPKQQFKIPDVFSYEEFEILIKGSKKTAYPLRNEAILEVLFGCGLRASEICDLQLSDIANKDHIRVTGKGSKERIVPIGRYARNAIKKYLNGTAIKKRHTNHVFLNRYGTQLTRHTIHKVTSQIGEIAGIENVHPHRFRHSFATVLLIGGADIRIVQSMLGHDNIRSTEVYLHLKLCDIVKKFKKTHPRYNAT